MTKPDIESLSREFCRLAGKVWHEEVGWKDEEVFLSIGDKQYKAQYKIRHINPDFTDAREVIKVMRKIGKLQELLAYLSDDHCYDSVHVNYIEDRTGLILEEAVKFMRLIMRLK